MADAAILQSSVPLRKFTVEGGLELFAISTADAQAEAFAHQDGQVYFGKGQIALREGDTVLDLGANVGSFARMAAPVLGPRGCIYCLEPIQDVFVALQLNSEVYKQWAQKHKLGIAKWVCIHAGAGSLTSPPQQEFVYYPNLSAMSSMYLDEGDAAAATCSLVINRPQSFSFIENVGKTFARCSPRLYRMLHRAAFTTLLLRPVRRVLCPMTSVSKLIHDHGIQEVGLLKANVERAEWDVLMGIRPEHWQRIRQLSLQVHDIGGRVAQMVQLLEARGYTVQVYQEPRFKDCNLHMVYGSR